MSERLHLLGFSMYIERDDTSTEIVVIAEHANLIGTDERTVRRLNTSLIAKQHLMVYEVEPPKGGDRRQQLPNRVVLNTNNLIGAAWRATADSYALAAEERRGNTATPRGDERKPRRAGVQLRLPAAGPLELGPIVEPPAPDPEAASTWRKALHDLELQVSADDFRTWFKGSEPISVDGRAWVIGVVNPLSVGWLTARCTKTVARTLGDYLGEQPEVTFIPIPIAARR